MMQILLFIAAFTLLSLSISRHYSQVTNSRQRLNKKQVWLFRFNGYCLIVLAMYLAISAWGVTLGLVYCCGTAMLVALTVSLILSYRPRWLSFITMK